ncbi:MAG TPA: MBL fold metallo-hydrolase [Myxococcales bacterium]|nr:MBL fold metallo-hydrolase [Myxococcales bacterium]
MRKKIVLLASALALASAARAAPPQANAAEVAARSKIFGAANVDARTAAVNPDRVIVSWLTNASFALAARGHVMLLDTYVTRLETTPGRTPVVIGDLTAMMPEAIMLGHGHFDHADNAAYIAQQTGATIYASPETCDNMAIDAANNVSRGYTTNSHVHCVSLTSRGSLPGTEIVGIDQFWPDLDIKVLKHLHSTNTGVTDPQSVPIAATSGGVCQPTAKGNTFPCNLQDPRDPALFPAGAPLSSVMNIATSRAGAGGPIALMFIITVPSRGDGRRDERHDFRLVWNNTAGDLVDSCALPNNVPGTNPPQPFEPQQDSRGCFPGVTVHGMSVGQNLESIMDRFAPVDVQLGSVVSLGYNQNGERDAFTYIQHLQPKVFVPNHVTAVAAEGSSLEWKVAFFQEAAALGIEQLPEVDWLVDPNDYLRPMVFDPSDARWR